MTTCDTYRKKFLELKCRKFRKDQPEVRQDEDRQLVVSGSKSNMNSTDGVQGSRKFKLPTIEFKKIMVMFENG